MRLFLWALPLLVAGSCLAEISSDVVQGYLDQMGILYDRVENEFMILMEDEQGEQWPVMYIGVEPDIDACYLAVFTPAVVPESGQERYDALETIMELNWSSLFGKFEVNPETGEVSVSYIFSTENGMGYEAFEAILGVLFGTVDENMEVLSAIQ
ncbi:YbjN domain-containing protein [Candidatus Fermentibacterales bacterium]|nr:YbjN domain-containing protein [Candidatus Fermentibacterales bacterium]